MPAIQRSSVHVLPSAQPAASAQPEPWMQGDAAVPTHAPALQVSSVVQTSPSSHAPAAGAYSQIEAVQVAVLQALAGQSLALVHATVPFPHGIPGGNAVQVEVLPAGEQTSHSLAGFAAPAVWH